MQSCRLALLEAVLDHPDLEELAIVIEAAELIGELADLEQVCLHLTTMLSMAPMACSIYWDLKAEAWLI